MKNKAFGLIVLSLLLISSGNKQNPGTGLNFELVLIDTGAYNNPWLKTTGDLNTDGKPDLVVGGYESGGLCWYMNPGWKKYQIAGGKGFSTDGEVRDINKDGAQDLICIKRPGIVWYRNPGSSKSAGWNEYRITDINLHDIELEDFDRDGDQDIVGRNQQEWGKDGDMIHFFRQDSPEKWTYFKINCPPGEGLLSADIDSDGLIDVVVNQKWYKNDGKINGTWKEFTYSRTWTHQNAFIAYSDINGDSKKDLVLAPAELATGTYRISWFEAPDNYNNTWPEHIIEDNVSCAFHYCGSADFDMDGDEDILVAEMTQSTDPDDIKIFVNTDKGNKWISRVINTDGSHSMRILDIDIDGDPDFFGANWRANGKDENIKLWLNVSEAKKRN